MVNQTFYNLGTAPSVIRQLFAYGLEQAKLVGPENVFDYSLGNPSIPAPAKVNQSIHDILNDTDSIKVHGYSMACGFDSAREAIAALFTGAGAQRIDRGGSGPGQAVPDHQQAARRRFSHRHPARAGSSPRCRPARSNRPGSWPGTAGGSPRRSRTAAPDGRSRW